MRSGAAFVVDGGRRLRRAIAALPPEGRRQVRERLGPPSTGGRPTGRPRRSVLAVLVWLRERAGGDPRWYAWRPKSGMR